MIVPILGDSQTARSTLSAMMTPDELNAILERITLHQQTEQDLGMLRRSLAGDLIYFEWNDEAIQKLVEVIQEQVACPNL